MFLEIITGGSHHLPHQSLVGGEDAKSRPMIQVLGPGGRGTDKKCTKRVSLLITLKMEVTAAFIPQIIKMTFSATKLNENLKTRLLYKIQ